MKRLLPLLLVSAAFAWAQAAKPMVATSPTAIEPAVLGPRIAPQSFTTLEGRFDAGLLAINSDMLGGTRAVYLRDYGIILTAEIMLVPTSTLSPFQPQISPAYKASVHERKIAQLPVLMKTMREMMKSSALAVAPSLVVNTPGRTVSDSFKSVDTSPLQIVLAVRLRYNPWEDMKDLPAQITMKATLGHALAGEIQEEVQ